MHHHVAVYGRPAGQRRGPWTAVAYTTVPGGGSSGIRWAPRRRRSRRRILGLALLAAAALLAVPVTVDLIVARARAGAHSSAPSGIARNNGVTYFLTRDHLSVDRGATILADEDLTTGWTC